jgi:hypothetical protein
MDVMISIFGKFVSKAFVEIKKCFHLSTKSVFNLFSYLKPHDWNSIHTNITKLIHNIDSWGQCNDHYQKTMLRSFFLPTYIAVHNLTRNRQFFQRKYFFNHDIGPWSSILSKSVFSRVARWFNFKPKIPIWVNFGGP